MMWFDTKEDELAHLASLEKPKAQAPCPVAYHEEHLTYPHVGKVRSLKDLQAQQKPKKWIIDEFGVSGACVLLAADKGSGKTSLMDGI